MRFLSMLSTRSARKAAVMVAAAALPIACGGPGADRARQAHAELVLPFAAAFREEAKGDPERAKKMVLDAIDVAARASAEPWQIAALEAELDALVERPVSAFSEATPDAALAFRTPGEAAVAERLERARAQADDPFAPSLLARSLGSLAEHRGDAVSAEKWRALGACAREAVVIGPVAWAPVTGVREAGPLDRFDAKLDAAYVVPGAFGLKQPPIVVRGRGCAIDLSAPSALPGVRDVVIDVDVPRAQTIGVSMRAHSAAVLRAGGRVVLERPYELGGGAVAQFARVESPAGKLRLVARVGTVEDGDSVEISATDEHGQPLHMAAPKIGDAGSVSVTRAGVVERPSPKTEDERLLFVASALAGGDGRTAERALSNIAARPDAPPDQLLLYARAVETAQDLSQVHRAERARAAYERVLDAWPTAWEAIVAHAVLASVRRGQSEARIEALKDLELRRAKAGPFAAPLLDAFDAIMSGRERMFDRARAALGRASGPLAGTSLLVDVGRVAIERVGAERTAYSCAAAPAHRRNDLDCFDALRATGDHAAALRELDRIRALFGAPERYLAIAMREALAMDDIAAARKIFDAMLPGERTIVALYAIARRSDVSREKVRELLHATALSSRDAPAAIPPVLHSMGDDPTAAFEGMAERIVAEDKSAPILPNAATAVLVHRERYDVDASGLVHFVMFDVRRVSGTTDVENNAQADAPDLAGRNALRALRRRIFKKDGRILEPDQTPRASQSHAELSQLEQGDTVEAIYEGWALPGETGDIGIDTPDLLPDRTAVRDGSIEIHLPEGLRGSLWSHPILGKPQETHEGGARVLRWTMKDHGVRRLEDGVPRMDRSVGVSFGTAEWAEVARALRETLASFDEHDPEIVLWAREAASGKPPGSRAMIEAVVDAAGKSVREAQAAMLSDVGVGRAIGPQSLTARTILTEHEGSRSWLITRALRELGVASDVVIAEDQPFSADPAFPPHFGRFMHPLVVAHVGGEDIWIDADVSGPPLPAGRISPELRGRSMMRGDGTIAPVPMPAASKDGDVDEIDLRLAIDDKGDAKGSFTVLLRGRDAQEIAEALFRIVGAERQRALRGVVLAWVPYANVDEVVLSSSEGSWQIGVRAQLSVFGYAQKEGKRWVLPGVDPLHYVFPRPHVASLSSAYASQGARENALAINSAVQYHVHRRLELPPGATITRMPGPFQRKASHLQATRSIAVSGTVIEDDFVLALSTGTIPASDYAAFVDDAHKTDDAFLSGTWVKPVSP